MSATTPPVPPRLRWCQQRTRGALLSCVELGGYEERAMGRRGVVCVCVCVCRVGLVRECWWGAGVALVVGGVQVEGDVERARFRLHLVRHRVALKNRVHATLLAFGRPCLTSDLFGIGGGALLDRLALPEPWAGSMTASLQLVDE